MIFLQPVSQLINPFSTYSNPFSIIIKDTSAAFLQPPHLIMLIVVFLRVDEWVVSAGMFEMRSFLSPQIK